jgi:hypothetical protein
MVRRSTRTPQDFDRCQNDTTESGKEGLTVRLDKSAKVLPADLLVD